MPVPFFDWNEAAAQIARERREMNAGNRLKGEAFWDMRAPSFAKHADETGYADAFLDIIKPESGMTVFDMGCGGGTLAVPLSGMVREVTAADFSPNMLAIVKDKMSAFNIRNINPVKLSWEDDWTSAGIGVHDIAIASRSMSVENIKEAVTKLSGAASKRVYISTVVGDGPHDRILYEAVGREIFPSVDYIYTYNILYQMGIHANVSFISGNDVKSYDTFDEALASTHWMFQDMTPEEEAKLNAFMKAHLVEKNGRWQKDYVANYKWAVIWWDK
ncbi:MAG: methyltransferase domain-containing protein [Leptospirales bacterium]|nr:methyltransferase domain-containing protein [Leptospirales bacterium]